MRQLRLLCAALALTLSAAACTPNATEARAGEPGPRNVILFLGDGMGVSTVTAARILAGQQQGRDGEEYALAFESFPNVALIKTYNVDAQVADSAGTMSAIMTGIKTRIGHISVAPDAMHGDCPAALSHAVPTLLEQAEDAGFATGVISTARLTHATPAATYAHVPDRDWESDANLPSNAAAAGCRDIARQLIEFDHGDGIELALGGGRAAFLPASEDDPEHEGVKGQRVDGRDLTREWVQARDGAAYVWNRQGFAALSAADPGPVLGLFEPSHMQYEADRANDPSGEPSLSEMTRFAIDKLSRNSRGYFLMVEGGRIDHGHHAGNAYRALTDAVAMSEAVQTALDATDRADTLILVTADHSHTMTISGYPKRGNPILGKVETPLGTLAMDGNGHPYTTIGYANGPGYQPELPDLTDVDTEALNYRQTAAVPLPSETHGGEDVAAYASGPNAEALRGVMEQNRIYFVLRDALFSGTTDAGGQ